jgi:hypothetical protein
MPAIHAARSAAIDAPPAVVYGIIADYRRGHPSILPEKYFHGLDVESGGVGAGTAIRFRMRAFGRTRESRAVVAEPEPGRVLTETIAEQGMVTTFTVDPLDGGARSAVEIATEWEVRGPRGWLERVMAPPFLRRVYAAELAKLARAAAAAA